MNFNLKHLIESGIKDGKDTEKMLHILAEKIDSDNSKIEIFEELYSDVYGKHLCDNFCMELVEHLTNGTETGQKWTIAEVGEAARKADITFSGKEEDYTKYEFWAAMHKMYYKYGTVFTESHIETDLVFYAKLADAYLTDNGVYTGELTDYFFLMAKTLAK